MWNNCQGIANWLYSKRLLRWSMFLFSLRSTEPMCPGHLVHKSFAFWAWVNKSQSNSFMICLIAASRSLWTSREYMTTYHSVKVRLCCSLNNWPLSYLSNEIISSQPSGSPTLPPVPTVSPKPSGETLSPTGEPTGQAPDPSIRPRYVKLWIDHHKNLNYVVFSALGLLPWIWKVNHPRPRQLCPQVSLLLCRRVSLQLMAHRQQGVSLFKTPYTFLLEQTNKRPP